MGIKVCLIVPRWNDDQFGSAELWSNSMCLTYRRCLKYEKDLSPGVNMQNDRWKTILIITKHKGHFSNIESGLNIFVFKGERKYNHKINIRMIR